MSTPFSRTLPASLCLVGLLCAGATLPLTAATVFHEDFVGDSSTNINGTAPDTRPGSETWTAIPSGTFLRTDGTIAATGGTSAWLPITLQSGHVYTVSASVNISYQTGSVTPIGIAFTSDSPLSTGAVNLADSNDYSVLQVRRGGSWVYFEGETNNSTPTASGTGLFTSSQTNYEIRLVLDTSGSNWTVAGYMAGNQIDLNGASAGLLFTYATNPTITGVGVNYGSSSFVFESFTVDAVSVIPEPSAAALLVGLGALGLTLGFRRTKRA